jgi:hypothetical protein
VVSRVGWWFMCALLATVVWLGAIARIGSCVLKSVVMFGVTVGKVQ